MKTTAKTVGKTTKETRASKLLSWFTESESSWVQVGEPLTLSAKELKSVVECKVRLFQGENGDFGRLYLTINLEGKLLSLQDGEIDSKGKPWKGVILDYQSTTRMAELIESRKTSSDYYPVDPKRVILYELKNIKTGNIVKRVRIY